MSAASYFIRFIFPQPWTLLGVTFPPPLSYTAILIGKRELGLEQALTGLTLAISLNPSGMIAACWQFCSSILLPRKQSPSRSTLPFIFSTVTVRVRLVWIGS